MLDKLKEKKGLIIGYVVSLLVLTVLSGIVATFNGEVIGYSTLTVFAYTLLGHNRIVKFVDEKLNK
jgi:hypothetical protein